MLLLFLSTAWARQGADDKGAEEEAGVKGWEAEWREVVNVLRQRYT